MHFDGQVTLDLLPATIDCVRLRRSEHKICFLHPPGYSYFAMLRQKLQWSEQPKVGRIPMLRHAESYGFRHRRPAGAEFFDRRFRCLTGETGAGKSILIDALAWRSASGPIPAWVRRLRQGRSGLISRSRTADGIVLAGRPTVSRR